VRQVRDDTERGARYIGPFSGRRAAEQAAEALLESVPLRSCTSTLSPRRPTPPCIRHDLGRCPAPCSGAIDVDAYAALTERAKSLLTADVSPMTEIINARMAELARAERFEEAAAWRDRLAAALRGITRSHRIGELADLAEMVAGRPRADGGWDVHVIRHGRLAGATTIPAGADVVASIEAVRATSEVVAPAPVPQPAALIEETEHISRWLESAGVRLVGIERARSGGVRAGPSAVPAEPSAVADWTEAGWASPRHSPVIALRRITATMAEGSLPDPSGGDAVPSRARGR
jgi:DNA polymerase-3 subunit epsilon